MCKNSVIETLLLNVIDSSFFFNLSNTLIFCGVKKIQGILGQSTKEKWNPSNCETFLLALFSETFLKEQIGESHFTN